MGVTTIELGIQSLDNKVLAASGRGHCGEDSLRAIACIKAAGLTVGAQLMPGLPGDTPASSFASLEQVITAGADFLRIYPTVVLKGTELARQYLAGEFVPLSLELGVSLCCLMLHRAAQAGIPVIRIGLQADEGLNAENVLAGCWHPALGQLVRSRLYADLIDRFVMSGNNATIFCHPSRLSDVVGLKRCNVQNQASRGVTMSVVTDNELSKEQLRVEVEGNIAIYSIFKDNNYSIKEV
jgi:histone acetyltransferase (RNA polymerase elongator complex component)